MFHWEDLGQSGLLGWRVQNEDGVEPHFPIWARRCRRDLWC